MLARLLEMTWTLSSMAIIPVAAVESARIGVSPFSIRHVGELVDRLLTLVALLLQHRGDLRVGAGDLDHPRHLADAAHVRFLDRTLHDRRLGRRLRRRAADRVEGAAAVLLQELRIGEIDDAQAAALAVRLGRAFAHADRAVLADRDLPVAGLEGDRPRGAENDVAFAGDELARGVDLQRAVARVTLAPRGLHREEARAINGDVERIARALDGPLAHVVPDAAVAHEADAAAAA